MAIIIVQYVFPYLLVIKYRGCVHRENDLLKGQLKRYVGLVKQQQETGEEAGPMGGAGPEKDLATKLSEVRLLVTATPLSLMWAWLNI